MFYPFTYPIEGNLALVKASLAMAPDLLRAVQKNSEHIGFYLQWVDTTNDLESEIAFLKMKLKEEADGTSALFFILDGQQIIGSVDLLNINLHHETAEIGYWLDADYTGRGIMTRAVQTLCSLAFEELKLHHLTIIADVENGPSNAVARNAGFTLVGTDRESFILRGTYRDINRWSLRKSDSQIAESPL